MERGLESRARPRTHTIIVDTLVRSEVGGELGENPALHEGSTQSLEEHDDGHLLGSDCGAHCDEAEDGFTLSSTSSELDLIKASADQ